MNARKIFQESFEAKANRLYQIQVSRMSTTQANLRFQSKTVLITASSRGIGLAVADRFASEGASVVISSRKKEQVEKSVAELTGKGYDAYGVVCNAGNLTELSNLVSKTVERYGKIDILVSNAGVNPYMGSIMGISEKQYDKIMDVNVKSSFFLVKLAYPHMPKNSGSSVIFNASVAAHEPSEVLGIYSVSKTALLGLVRLLRLQLGRDGIRINAVAPGIIKTRFAGMLWQNEKSAVTKHQLSTIPLKRFGNPDDVAGVVAFLASEDAKYITGETIVVSGGTG
eukprot:740649_1